MDKMLKLSGYSVSTMTSYPSRESLKVLSAAVVSNRFCQMLLNQGALGGRQYLKPESVKLMNTIQTGELKTGFTDGNGWGLGCCVVRKPTRGQAGSGACHRLPARRERLQPRVVYAPTRWSAM